MALPLYDSTCAVGRQRVFRTWDGLVFRPVLIVWAWSAFDRSNKQQAET